MGKSSRTRYWQKLRNDIFRDRWLYLLILPGIVWYLIYRYLPMAGLSLAFHEYDIKGGMFNVYKLIFYFPVPILFAMFLNEILSDGYKRVLQTLIYLPHFVSWVVFGSIIITFLNPSEGIVNQIIQIFGGKPIFFLSDPKYFRGIVILSDIWKEAGYGTIIYLAAITGIDPALYEAGKIDGATRWQAMRYITLPCISETIVVMLLLDIGRIMNVGFDQIYVLANSAVYSTGDVISTYVYRLGIGNGRFSLTTAIGLFQSVIGFVMIVSCNALSRRFADKGLW